MWRRRDVWPGSALYCGLNVIGATSGCRATPGSPGWGGPGRTNRTAGYSRVNAATESPGGGVAINERVMHTNPAPNERAILAGFPALPGMEDTLDELELLAGTAGADVAGRVRQRRESVHPGNFLSKGKTEEAKTAAAGASAKLLICDEELSPAQVRNLEKALDLRVIDRTELILDIFSQRARTREAHLQVELAQLRYLLPRLAGMWGHFSRTGGGIGTRGPGETQLEVDRRRVRQKITFLERHLESVEVERRTQAKRRMDAVRISLVGYTNAGKSTLFNQLTRSDVLVEDKLFATLDTTTRKLGLTGGGSCFSPTRLDSSVSCRTTWWRRSGPPCARWRAPICCSMSSMPPTRRVKSRFRRWKRSSPRCWNETCRACSS